MNAVYITALADVSATIGALISCVLIGFFEVPAHQVAVLLGVAGVAVVVALGVVSP